MGGVGYCVTVLRCMADMEKKQKEGKVGVIRVGERGRVIWEEFSEAEMSVLVHEVELRKEALFGDYKEGESPKYRWLIWQEVAEKVNEVNPAIHRNLEQVRIKWFDYKNPNYKIERKRKRRMALHTTGMFFKRRRNTLLQVSKSDVPHGHSITEENGDDPEEVHVGAGLEKHDSKDGETTTLDGEKDTPSAVSKISPNSNKLEETLKSTSTTMFKGENDPTCAIKYLSHTTQRKGMALAQKKVTLQDMGFLTCAETAKEGDVLKGLDGSPVHRGVVKRSSDPDDAKHLLINPPKRTYSRPKSKGNFHNNATFLTEVFRSGILSQGQKIGSKGVDESVVKRLQLSAQDKSSGSNMNPKTLYEMMEILKDYCSRNPHSQIHPKVSLETLDLMTGAARTKANQLLEDAGKPLLDPPKMMWVDTVKQSTPKKPSSLTSKEKQIICGHSGAEMVELIKSVDPKKVKQMHFKHPKTGKEMVITKIAAVDAISALQHSGSKASSMQQAGEGASSIAESKVISPATSDKEESDVKVTGSNPEETGYVDSVAKVIPTKEQGTVMPAEVLSHKVTSSIEDTKKTSSLNVPKGALEKVTDSNSNLFKDPVTGKGMTLAKVLKVPQVGTKPPILVPQGAVSGVGRELPSHQASSSSISDDPVVISTQPIPVVSVNKPVTVAAKGEVGLGNLKKIATSDILKTSVAVELGKFPGVPSANKGVAQVDIVPMSRESCTTLSDKSIMGKSVLCTKSSKTCEGLVKESASIQKTSIIDPKDSCDKPETPEVAVSCEERKVKQVVSTTGRITLTKEVSLLSQTDKGTDTYKEAPEPLGKGNTAANKVSPVVKIQDTVSEPTILDSTSIPQAGSSKGRPTEAKVVHHVDLTGSELGDPHKARINSIGTGNGVETSKEDDAKPLETSELPVSGTKLLPPQSEELMKMILKGVGLTQKEGEGKVIPPIKLEKGGVKTINIGGKTIRVIIVKDEDVSKTLGKYALSNPLQCKPFSDVLLTSEASDVSKSMPSLDDANSNVDLGSMEIQEDKKVSEASKGIKLMGPDTYNLATGGKAAVSSDGSSNKSISILEESGQEDSLRKDVEVSHRNTTTTTMITARETSNSAVSSPATSDTMVLDTMQLDSTKVTPKMSHLKTNEVSTSVVQEGVNKPLLSVTEGSLPSTTLLGKSIPRKPNILSSANIFRGPSISGGHPVVAGSSPLNSRPRLVVRKDLLTSTLKIGAEDNRNAVGRLTKVQKHQHPLVKAALTGKLVDFQTELKKLDLEECVPSAKVLVAEKSSQKRGDSLKIYTKTPALSEKDTSGNANLKIKESPSGALGNSKVMVLSEHSYVGNSVTGGLPDSSGPGTKTNPVVMLGSESPVVVQSQRPPKSVGAVAKGTVSTIPLRQHGSRICDVGGSSLKLFIAKEGESCMTKGGSGQKPEVPRVVKDARVGRDGVSASKLFGGSPSRASPGTPVASKDLDDCVIVEEVYSRGGKYPEVYYVDSNESFSVQVNEVESVELVVL